MALQDDIDKLARIPLFEALGTEALRLIAFAAEARILRAGDVLFRRGDRADGGYVVISGALALEVDDTGGPAPHIAQAGELVGELALLTPIERPVTALAREPTTVLRVPRPLFHRVLKEYPEAASRLQHMMQERVEGFARELDEMRQRALED
ncbi:cyclic nucleotide-binding domain-containing protein [Methylovirgula sp. 4M-Z18]|uniref:cyclic nucleotide-binding domain-containing protein n=1 Tax=Methylovirgula sp. 4M-Z18 TaxID=2293567 RepID=UPI000E2E9552|nr:cyclic nucleotide-binding domain-containing protein [Methylovirgula sp. 4M-Z18]RFB78511.1 cyclic nucleotide-binding domain-containing protein [Methylovirgula sp. 4M-Z18]